MIRTVVRLLLTVALACVSILVAASRVRADVIEYCPAELAAPAQVVAPDQIGLRIQSDGPRSVSGSLLILTAAGWYQADFNAIDLVQTTINGNDQGISYTGHAFRSQTFYVNLPNAGRILYAFVAQAQATGDPTFGWDQRGMVGCDPPPDPGVRVAADLRGEPIEVLALPQASSVVLGAQRVAAPSGFSLQCPTPFVYPKVRTRANSELDTNDLGVRGKFAVYLRVAVNEQGKVDGAWARVSSGYPEFDKAMILEATRSTYVPASSFCGPVRSYYDYRMTMNNNRR